MINQKLIQARKQRLWTQEQASAKAGIAVGTYRRWEAGTQLPHSSTLALLCDAFKMSASDLGYLEDLFPPSREADGLATPVYEEPEQKTSFLPLAQKASAQPESEERDRQRPTSGQNLYTLADEQLRAFASLLRPGEKSMFDPQKRKTLETLLTALSMALVQPSGLLQMESLQHLLTPETGLVKPNEATIQGFAKLMEACWQLSRGNELALAEKLLPECMTSLVPLAQYPSKYQQAAANLTVQGYRLYGIFALHKNNLLARELYCKQAVQYSLFLEDRNLLITSLRSLGHTYYYKGQYLQALQTYLDALQYAENVSPLLQASVYMDLAVAYGHIDQRQDSFTYLGLANDTFPDYPEMDASFSFAEFDLSQMILWEGVVRTQLGETKEALDIFNHIDQPGIVIPERIRLEILNQRAKTALVSGDLEQGSAYIEAGVHGAKALGSQRRLNEAYDNYKQVSLLWPQEQRVKELGELFVR